MELCKKTFAAIGSLLLFSVAANSKTIDFGNDPTPGPVPPGYAGFNWGTGANQAINVGPDGPDFLLTTGPAVSIETFGRSKLFDLNSVEFQVLSDTSYSHDSIDYYTTVVSGYRGNTLIKSVTESYNDDGQSDANSLFTNLNIDGVTSIRFTTTDKTVFLDNLTGLPDGSYTTPYTTFVETLNVSKYKAHSAPEIDPASLISMLTLLLGGIAVITGTRRIKTAAQPAA